MTGSTIILIAMDLTQTQRIGMTGSTDNMLVIGITLEPVSYGNTPFLPPAAFASSPQGPTLGAMAR